MPEIDVAAYKEAVFGNNGQTNIQPPTPEKPTTVPPVSTEANPVVSAPPIVDKPSDGTPPVITEKEIVDANEPLKTNLGYESWDAAKEEIAALKAKAETPAEIKYANEQSKALHEAILAGKTEEVYAILDTQAKLSKVADMKADEVLKLHISQTNKHYSSEDIKDVFDEKYAYPEKPTQKDDELDDEYKVREERWEESKAKIDRRKERDAVTAKADLSKLSAEIKLPDIQKPPEAVNEEEQKELQKLEAETKEAYSKLSPKDISMVFKFNDEASKLAFDIAYEPEKDSFDKAVSLASDMKAFFESYYDKDGSPLRKEFLRDLYAGRNIQKIVSEAMVEATNQTKNWFLANQKNINNGVQRNFTIPPVSDVDRLRTAVFGK